MIMRNDLQGVPRTLALLARLTLLGGVLVLASPATASDAPGSEKLQRQLGLFEQMTNQMLLDSPNFLVSGRKAARALYLEEFGAVISWNASLVNKGKDGFWEKWDFGKFRIERDGNRTIIIGPEDGEEMDEEMAETYQKWVDGQDERQARLYEEGKEEMIELLLDYAEIVSRLADDQWVMLAAFLQGHEFFENNDLSRLTVKARMADIRAYAGGDIDRDTLRDRLVILEY